MPATASESAGLPSVVGANRILGTGPVAGVDLADLYGSRAEATWRAYAADGRAYLAWCSDAGHAPTSDPVTVATYLKAMAGDGFKLSTIRRRLAGLVRGFAYSGTPLDRRDPALELAMKAIANKIGAPKRGRAAITPADLAAMVKLLPAGPRGVRDRALLLLGFAGGFRRSELVALRVADIEFGRDGAVITVRRSKTDQTGQGEQVGIRFGKKEATCPLRAVRAWIAATSRTVIDPESPLFCRVVEGKPTGEQMIGKAVERLVKALGAAIGLDPARLGAHSLRVGCATALAAAGVDIATIAAHLRHKRLDTTRGYVRRATVIAESPTAALGL